jgi:hypothetical protein
MPIMDDPSKDASKLEALAKKEMATVVMQNVVEYCADRMAYLVRKHRIKREISCMIYGQTDKDDELAVAVPVQEICMEAYERIRNYARALMRQRSAVTQSEAREDSIGFWETILSDPDVGWSVKARARENLDEIHRVKPMGATIPVGVASQETVKLSDLGLDLAARKQALAALRARNDESVAAEDAAQRTLNVPIPS